MRVRVETPARLHFGFLDLSGESGRLYGGLGVGVDRPRAVVEAEPASGVEVVGADDSAEHFERLVSEAVDTLDVQGARVDVVDSLPRHVGLGSGTQHASAVLEAVGRANGVSPTRDDVRELGRGVRSGVGRGVFERGGFVADAGHPPDADHEDRKVPAITAHHPLPTNWRFVVAVPEGKGAHGEDEERSMERVVGTDERIAEEVRREFVARVLPGAAEGDAALFGAGVEEIDRLNGEWYSDSGEQGGVYDDASAGVIEQFKQMKSVAGAGQSSWGPAAYALTTQEHADEVAAAVEEETFVSAPDNEGVRVSLLRRR